jgi:hypothetical protein
MMPTAGESPAPSSLPPPRRRHRPRPSLIISSIFTAISITNSSYYAVVHPPTHLYIVLYKYGV